MKKHVVALMMSTLLVLTNGFALAGKLEPAKNNQTTEKPGTVSEDARAVADLAMAAQLAEYGKRVGNPVSLLGAAQIMKNTPTQDKKLEKKSEGTPEESRGDKKGKLDTVDLLLAQAKTMAEEKGLDTVADLVARESQVEAHRGAVRGPIQTQESVLPRRTDSYDITFRGREIARILLIGDGDCDLDLFVYDEFGNEIRRDTDGTDQCLVSWVPAFTGKFKVKIKNWGHVYADYILATN